MTIPPDVRRRQRHVARWVRRAPGYRVVVQHVLPRVQRSTVLNDLAWRVFMPGKALPGSVLVPFRGGVHLTGDDVARLPIVGFLALGFAREQLVALLEQLADVQRRTRGFRPLLLVDLPVFAEARAHGYVVDLLIPQAGWADQDDAWARYIAHRVLGATDHYELSWLVTVQPGGLSAIDVGVLEELATRLPEERDVVPGQAQPRSTG